jgi:hypothetical protein
MVLLASVGVSSAAYAAGAPPIVVDADGKVVGTLIGQNRIMRDIGGLLVGIDVTVGGFSSTSVPLLFTTTDCTGTKYRSNQSLPVETYTEVDSSDRGTAEVFYPAGVTKTIKVRSFGTAPDACTALPAPSPTKVGVIHSRTLTFTPPFSIR